MADTTEYIDFDNGNDSTGDGSSGSPWKTPSGAASNLSAVGSGFTMTYKIRNGSTTFGTLNDHRFAFTSNFDGVNFVVEPDTGEPTPQVFFRFSAGAGDPGNITVTANTPSLTSAGSAILIIQDPGSDFGFNINWTGNIIFAGEGRENRFLTMGTAGRLFTGDVTISGNHSYLTCVMGVHGGWSGTLTLSGTNDFGLDANYGAGTQRPVYQYQKGQVIRVGSVVDTMDYTGEPQSGLYDADGVNVGNDTVLWDIQGDFTIDTAESMVAVTDDIQDAGTGTFQVRIKDNTVNWDSTGYVLRLGDVNFSDTANDMPRTAAYSNGTQRFKSPILDNCTISNPGTGDGTGEVLQFGPCLVPPVDGEGFVNSHLVGAGTGHTVTFLQLMRFDGTSTITNENGIAALFYGGIYVKSGASLTLRGKTCMYPARSGDSNWESVQRFENHGTIIFYHTLTKAEFDATTAATDLNRAAFTDRGGFGNPTETFQNYMDGGEQAADRPDPYGDQWKHYGVNSPEAGPTYSDVGPLGLNWVKVGKIQIIKQDDSIPAFRFGRPSGASTHTYIETSDVQTMRDFAQGTGTYSSQSAWFYNDADAFLASNVTISGGFYTLTGGLLGGTIGRPLRGRM